MPAFDPANIDVPDMLECLDLHNITQATSEEMRFSCPFTGHANGDEKASAFMNVENSLWYCHGCKRKGNGVQFVEEILGVSKLEAIRMLKQRYQPGGININARNTADEIRKILAKNQQNQEKPQPVLPPDALDRFSVDWHAAYSAYQTGNGYAACDYIFERGFMPETLEAWEFGYDNFTGRITFAVRDEDGRLIGFKGRAPDHRHPKYLVIGDDPKRPGRYGWDRYHTSRVVFGAHRAGPGEVVVCEGELNAVAIWQKTRRDAVAINGSQFTPRHARILKRIATSVVLFLDSDTAGSAATDEMIDALTPFMPVRLVPDHEGDPADMTPEEIMSTLTSSTSSLLAKLQS